MKRLLLKIIKLKVFQPFWEELFNLCKIAMNYYGGAVIEESGELFVMEYVKKKLNKSSPLVIFDGGANVGRYSSAASEHFPLCKIYAFEPSPLTFRHLENKVRKLSSVVTVNRGLGFKRRSASLYSPHEASFTSSIYPSQHIPKVADDALTEEIELDTIDDFCLEMGIEEIDLLKMDIEGSEYEALCGAQRMLVEKKIKFLQFEFGECAIDARIYFKDLYNLLTTNYKIYRILPGGLHEIREYTAGLEVFGLGLFLGELRSLNSR